MSVVVEEETVRHKFWNFLGVFLGLWRGASGGNQQFYDTKVREWLANKVRESRQGLGKAPAAGDVADRLLCIQGEGGGSAEY